MVKQHSLHSRQEWFDTVDFCFISSIMFKHNEKINHHSNGWKVHFITFIIAKDDMDFVTHHKRKETPIDIHEREKKKLKKQYQWWGLCFRYRSNTHLLCLTYMKLSSSHPEKLNINVYGMDGIIIVVVVFVSAHKVFHDEREKRWRKNKISWLTVYRQGLHHKFKNFHKNKLRSVGHWLFGHWTAPLSLFTGYTHLYI